MRDLDRAVYLQQEVQRLATVCHDQQRRQTQHHEKLVAQALTIETLQARLEEAQENGNDQKVAELQDLVERERGQKTLLHEELCRCSLDYSHECMRRHALLSVTEDARSFITQLVAHLDFSQQQLSLAQRDVEATASSAEGMQLTDIAHVCAQMQLQATLAETNSALQQAEEEGRRSHDAIRVLREQLQASSDKIQDLQDKLYTSSQTAEQLSPQLSLAQQQQQRETQQALAPSYTYTNTHTSPRSAGSAVESGDEAIDETGQGGRLCQRQRVHELEAANKWLEAERLRLINLLHATSSSQGSPCSPRESTGRRSKCDDGEEPEHEADDATWRDRDKEELCQDEAAAGTRRIDWPWEERDGSMRSSAANSPRDETAAAEQGDTCQRTHTLHAPELMLQEAAAESEEQSALDKASKASCAGVWAV